MLLRAKAYGHGDSVVPPSGGDLEHHESPAPPHEVFGSHSLTPRDNPLLQTSLGLRKENRIAAFIIALSHPDEDPAPFVGEARALSRWAIGELASLSNRLHALDDDSKPDAFGRLSPEVFERIGERLFRDSKLAVPFDTLGAELLKVYETRYLEHVPDLGDWLGVVELCTHAPQNFHSSYRYALQLLDPREKPSFAARLREDPPFFRGGGD